MGKINTLYFSNIKIGEVISEDQNFLNCFGRVNVTFDRRSSTLTQKIQDYIDYSIKLDEIGLSCHYGQPWEDFMLAKEAAYIDLIESDDWYFLDEIGSERTKILIPIFTLNNGVIWRYDFS